MSSPRDEAERLVAAGLGAVSTALQDMETRRQFQGFAERMFGADQMSDLAAGLNGFMAGAQGSGAAGAPGSGAAGGAASGTDDGAHESSVPHGPRFSTGSADCCICPVCRVIAALRDPSPELAERLATAAGDLAVGVAGVLRAFDLGGDRDSWQKATSEDAPVPPQRSGPDDAPDGTPETPKAATPPRPMAKKAVKKAAPPVPDDQT